MRAFAALRCDCDFLQRKRDSGEDLAALKDGCSVAEDEVYGAVDVAFAVELAERVSVECVLVAFYAAPVEG